jgi:hypothetical protein
MKREKTLITQRTSRTESDARRLTTKMTFSVPIASWIEDMIILREKKTEKNKPRTFATKLC